MRSRWLLVFLVGCSSAPSAVEKSSCEPGVTQPFSLVSKKREVYVERTVGEGCATTERLVWGKSSLPIPGGEGWLAGDLQIWKGQISLDQHQIVDGHPLDCRNRLYKFGKKKLEFVRASNKCGP